MEMEKEGREAKPAEAMVTTVAYTCFSNVVLKRFISQWVVIDDVAIAYPVVLHKQIALIQEKKCQDLALQCDFKQQANESILLLSPVGRLQVPHTNPSSSVSPSSTLSLPLLRLLNDM